MRSLGRHKLEFPPSRLTHGSFQRLDLFAIANIMDMFERVQVRSIQSYTLIPIREVWFSMSTEQAYRAMEEANHIIEDFSVGRYALYTLAFLTEIALCFALLYAF